MDDFLLIGTCVGLLLGLMHTTYLAKAVVTSGNAATAPGWLYLLNLSGWTLLLWLLMGAYVFGFWLVAVVFWLVFKAFRS